MAKLLPAVALRRRAIGKMLLAGGAIGKRLMAEVALRCTIGKTQLAGPPLRSCFWAGRRCPLEWEDPQAKRRKLLPLRR